MRRKKGSSQYLRQLYGMLLLFGFIGSARPIQAQAEIKTVTLYGFISDRGSERPLEYASIELLNISPRKIAGTDAEGKFELKDVPVGRHRLLISLEGYEDVVMNDLLVESGKRLYIKVALDEREIIKNLDTGKTKPKPKTAPLVKSTKDKPINQMSGISARPFTIEEATRYAGARFDPARMVTNYAGAAGYDDSRNDIVVRGNTPSFILWQIEELPVDNPNHFMTMGVTGGVTPIVNVFALDNSDFLTGSYAAQYGNAISGIFDLRLRAGNSNRFGFMGQLGTQRGEVMIEGPLSSKLKGGSYLLSMRASTGNYFLKNIVSTDPAHQDVNLKISTGMKNWGELEFFAVAGVSQVRVPYQQTTYPDSTGSIFLDPIQQAYYTKVRYEMFEYEDYLHRSIMGMAGLKYTANLGKKTFWRTVAGATTHQTFYRWAVNYEDSTGAPTARVTTFSGDNIRNNYMLHSYVNSKIDRKLTLKGGIMANIYDLYFYEVYQLFGTVDFDYDGVFTLMRGYAQARYTPTNNFTINAGLSTQYSSLNKQIVAEPRFAMNWEIVPQHTFSLGYGLTHRMPPYSVMLFRPEIGTDSLGHPIYYTDHYKLKFIGSHQLDMQYDWQISQDFRLRFGAYAQFLFNVPSEIDRSSYSLLNEGASFYFAYPGPLNSNGKGRNMGIELTLEKSYSKGFYTLFSATYFDSKYAGSNGVWFNTRYNSKYIANVLAGKEFLLGKTKRNALFTDIRFSTAGGRPYSPIDLQATFNNPVGTEIYYPDKINSKRLKPSYQVDFKIGFRINGNRVSHIFKIDLFNVTALMGVKNPYTVRYSERVNIVSGSQMGTEQIIYQRGFIPDITYTIQF